MTLRSQLSRRRKGKKTSASEIFEEEIVKNAYQKDVVLRIMIVSSWCNCYLITKYEVS
jgi:hypothetical protein